MSRLPSILQVPALALAFALAVSGCLSGNDPAPPAKDPDPVDTVPNPPQDTTKKPDTVKPADTSAYSDKTGLTTLTLRTQFAVLRVKDGAIRFQLADPPPGTYYTGYHLHAAGLGDLGLKAPYEKIERQAGPFLLSLSAQPFSQWARPVGSASRWQVTPPETRFASLANLGTWHSDSPEARDDWMRALPKRSSAGTWVHDGFYDRKSGTHFVLTWFDRPARIAETYTLCGEEKRAEAIIPKAGVFALPVTYPDIHLAGGPLALSRDLVTWKQQIELITDSLIPDLRACRAPTRSQGNPGLAGTWRNPSDTGRLRAAELLPNGHARFFLQDSLGQDSLATGTFMTTGDSVRMEVYRRLFQSWLVPRRGDTLEIPPFGATLVKATDSTGISDRIKPLRTLKFLGEPGQALDIAWTGGSLWVTSGGHVETRERIIQLDTAGGAIIRYRDTLSLSNSGGVALDGEGNLWVGKANLVHQVDTATGAIRRTLTFPPLDGHRNHIASLSIDGGRIYAMFNPGLDGETLRSIPLAGGAAETHGHFTGPAPAAVCVRDGEVWYARGNHIHVRKLDAAKAHATYRLMEPFDVIALEPVGDAIWAIRRSIDPVSSPYPDVVKLGPR